jgi:hypothetical protein
MKRYFRTGWYGGATAMITTYKNGTATLVIGRKFRKTYATERGARIALGKTYDGTWYEVKEG